MIFSCKLLDEPGFADDDKRLQVHNANVIFFVRMWKGGSDFRRCIA
ncbi:hypothetical protein OROGR_012990 [Orobanche gracilis]